MRIDYTLTPTCPRCGHGFFWKTKHGEKGKKAFNNYLLLTCKKCHKMFEMRLYDKQPAYDNKGDRE